VAFGFQEGERINPQGMGIPTEAQCEKKERNATNIGKEKRKTAA